MRLKTSKGSEFLRKASVERHAARSDRFVALCLGDTQHTEVGDGRKGDDADQLIPRSHAG